MPSPWMDSQKAPLNACSLETIPEPVELADGTQVWPLMLSCYQLEDDASRQGRMDLHLVRVPDIVGSNLSSMPLQLGEPRTMPSPSRETVGVLDGQWSSSLSKNSNDRSWCFASAHSNGKIQLHSFDVSPDKDLIRLESEPLYSIKFLGESDPPETDLGVAPLCLSLRWNSGAAYKQDSEHRSSPQIVSTYSNGKVAIHDVSFLADSVQIIERDSWQAHNMFTSNAEVWSACFQRRNVVLSCGDEGNLKLWDTRSTSRPMQVFKHFEAGVTCISPHPNIEHLVACGSYDETIRLYDVRYMDEKQSLIHTKKLGGGIWRIKWHPYSSNRMLVAAMHGGCCVLQIQGMTTVPIDGVPWKAPDSDLHARVTKRFTEHESMAYGADWLVCKHPTRNGYFEAAGSCSFYDKAVFLWDSVF